MRRLRDTAYILSRGTDQVDLQLVAEKIYSVFSDAEFYLSEYTIWKKAVEMEKNNFKSSEIVEVL